MTSMCAGPAKFPCPFRVFRTLPPWNDFYWGPIGDITFRRAQIIAMQPITIEGAGGANPPA